MAPTPMESPSQEGLRPVLREIHGYWFGELAAPDEVPKDKSEMWFTRSDLTDDYIRDHFGSFLGPAAAVDWDVDALSGAEQAALVVLFDQFPRNLFRTSGEAFGYDEKARSITRRIDAAARGRLSMVEQLFLALPFEHHEDIADQDRYVWLIADMATNGPERFRDYARWALDHAMQHRDIIRRFGRFPHRNGLLGRTSTDEEKAFLGEKGGVFWMAAAQAEESKG